MALYTAKIMQTMISLITKHTELAYHEAVKCYVTQKLWLKNYSMHACSQNIVFLYIVY